MLCIHRENVWVHTNRAFVFKGLCLWGYSIPESFGIALGLWNWLQNIWPSSLVPELEELAWMFRPSICSHCGTSWILTQLLLKILNVDHLDFEWRLCSKMCDELSINKKPRVTLTLFSCNSGYQLCFQTLAKEIFMCFGFYLFWVMSGFAFL